MIIKVDKNFVDFDNVTNINKNEYNVTELRFQFSKEYEGLTCKAIFKKVDDDVYYERAIIDNKCEIPSEVLDGVQILIGVYAYELKNNELIKRYSPSPKKIVLLEGSYYDGASTPEEITPSQFEQYTAYLNSQIERLNKVKIETKELSDGVKISVTNVDGKVTETEVYNGETGPQGPQGEPGATGAPGRDGYVQYTAGNNITIEDNVISASGESYTAGDNITIEDGVISATDTTYTAGTGIDITNNVISATGGDTYKQVYFLTTNISALFGPTSLNATDIATLNKVVDDYRAGKDILVIAKNMTFWESDNQTLSCYNVIGIISSGSNWINISFYSNRYQGDKITTWEGAMYRNLRLNNVATPANIKSASFPAINAPNEIYNLIPPKRITGYNASKTQILKNINGTLTWVDE